MTTPAEDTRMRTFYFLIFIMLVGFVALTVAIARVEARSAKLEDVSRLAHDTCVNLEAQKAIVRDAANKTIRGDRKLLEDTDGHGIPGIPAATIRQDIADKLDTLRRAAPKPCD